MVYDTKTCCLLHGKKRIRLAKLERKLLIILSSKHIVTYNEIAKYIYNNDFENIKVALRGLVKRFRNKTGLKITSLYYVGYILKDDVYFR